MWGDSGKVSDMIGQSPIGHAPSVAALLACLAIMAGGAQAQSAGGDPPTGRVLSFSVGLGLTATDNPDFRSGPADGEVSASTSLGLQLRSNTALSSLALNADTLLLQKLSGNDKGFERPRQGVSLGYSRDGAHTVLKLNASLRESRINFMRPLTDFIDEDGEIVLPDDLDDLSGTGWRRQAGVDATVTLGRDAPFGAVLGAGLSDVSYRDTNNPALEDSERRNASAQLRFNLTPVTQLNLGLRYSNFRNSEDRRETWSLNPGLTFDRPDGSYRALMGITRTEDGTRLSAELGRVIERPWGKLDGRIGAVRLASGNTALSGGLRMNYAMRLAQLGIGLDRSAVSGRDDSEVLRTSLLVNYQRQMTERSSLTLNLSYVTSDNRVTGSTTDNASFGLSYNHTLTENWSANVGYSYRMRDVDGALDRTNENQISIGLSRRLVFGF